MTHLTPEEKCYVWLDAFPLPLAEKNRLLREAGSGVALVKNCKQILENAIKEDETGVYNDMVRSLSDGSFFQSLVNEFNKTGVRAVPRPNEEFFDEWRNLKEPPLVQYERGNAALKRREKFAMVGSRRTCPQAMKRAETVAAELAEQYTLVTGNADGGDLAVRIGVRQTKGGGCICVLPEGLSAVKDEKAEESVLFVTEHVYNASARKFSYERRNELLAALGTGVLIVSAGEKSGALITAKYAEAAQKPIFAFPYAPETATGKGCNALIKRGAHLTESADDVFEQTGKTSRCERKQETAALTENETLVFEALKQSGTGNVNTLARQTGIPVWKLSGVVTSLEIKGLIVRTGGNGISLL